MSGWRPVWQSLPHMRWFWTLWLILASPLQAQLSRSRWAGQQIEGKKTEWILLAKHHPVAAPSPALHSRAEGRKKHWWQISSVRIFSGWTYSDVLLCTCDPTGGRDAMPAGCASRAEKPEVTSAFPALKKILADPTNPSPKKLSFKGTASDF